VTTKVCPKCRVEKGLGEFHRNVGRKDGRCGHCKSCVKLASAKFYAENSDKIKAYQAKYKIENSDKLKAQKAKYRAENKEEIRVRDAEFYAENKEEIRVRQAEFYAENSEKMKARQAKYQAENLEKVKAYKARIVIDLEDTYVKTQVKLPNPPQELIEHKREQLLMYRATRDLLKTLKDEDNE